MGKIKLLLTFITIGILSSCSQQSSPVEPEQKADLSISMLLKPASEAGYNVTRVLLKISRATFVDSMNLTINGESASGTFTDLNIGNYQIDVKVYEDTTLIATGSGTGEVKAGQTAKVTITVTFLKGNMEVTVNWGGIYVEPNTLLFEMDTGASIDIQGVNNAVNGTVKGDYVEWDENLSAYNPTDDGLHDLENFPDDVRLVFKLHKSGKYSVKAYCTSNNYEHLFTTLTWGKYISGKSNRIPSEKWLKSSYYDKTIAADYKNFIDLYKWNLLFTRIMGYEFGFLYESGYTTNGPSHMLDFSDRSYQNSILLSGFNFPVLLLFSMIRHQQADYMWYNENWKNWDTYINSNFSMAPQNVWDLNFSSKRYFNISIQNPQKICIYANANNDNSNSCLIKINNIEFVSRTNCCGKERNDYSLIPTKIEINAYSSWSWVGPLICIITQANNITVSDWHEERDGVVDPADSWDKNPKPLILKINQSGTTLL